MRATLALVLAGDLATHDRAQRAVPVRLRHRSEHPQLAAGESGEIAEPAAAALEPDGPVGRTGQPRLPDPACAAGAGQGAAAGRLCLLADAGRG
ncbi:hypothetical protein G6F46_015467 [Rhizopus delemar]|nr:hypothetical protein G6F24_017945 [Rhizopus arrhizus]KAG1580785.1 hypothetical protein G6F46_015467 [Rhizopus delemar]